MDNDGDGWTDQDGDCADDDPDIHPGAQDDDCNGRDDDCDGLFDEDRPAPAGLLPGEWTEADMYGSVLAQDASWGFWSVAPAGGAKSAKIVASAGYGDGPGDYALYEGVATYTLPSCPGNRDPERRSAFVHGGHPHPPLDANGDCVPDQRIGNAIVLGPLEGEYTEADVQIAFLSEVYDVATGDLDSDGDADLVGVSDEWTAFWSGPLGALLTLDDAVLVPHGQSDDIWRPGITVVTPPGQEPVTLSGRTGWYDGGVSYVNGMPDAGQTSPDGELDLSPWYSVEGHSWGALLQSNGGERVCLGRVRFTDHETQVCGTWSQLLQGTEEVIAETNGDSGVDLTSKLIAVGTPEGVWWGSSYREQIRVFDSSGLQWTITCEGVGCSAFYWGASVALVEDPRWSHITWLVTVGIDGVQGPPHAPALHFFALDTSTL